MNIDSIHLLNYYNSDFFTYKKNETYIIPFICEGIQLWSNKLTPIEYYDGLTEHVKITFN